MANREGGNALRSDGSLALSEAAVVRRGETPEDESIKDLRKAILSQVATSDTKRRAETPEELRSNSELLDPDTGRLRDVAQPGGFRRHHVRQLESSTVNNSHVQTSLMQLLQPDIMLSFLKDLEDPDSPYSSFHADPHAVAPRGASSNLATAIIIIKCCFGSAVLIVPHGFKTAGWLGAPVCLIAVYIFMVVGMLKLVDCRRATPGGRRYQDLGAVWGSFGIVYINVASVLLVTGFNCIWCVTCQQNLGMVVPEWNEVTRLWVFMPAVAVLALVRRLKVFTITNLIGIVLCLGTAVFLAFYAGEELATNGPKKVIEVDTENGDWLLWVGACGYIFELITNVIPVYEAAADKEAVPKLLVGCTLGVIIVYLSFGYMFSLAMGDGTAELATLNLPPASFEGKLIPLLFSLVGIVTMPINVFITCQAYEPLFVWSENYTIRKWKKNVVRIMVVCGYYLLTWAGGSQLQNFLALVGGLLGANLSMVVPCLLHISICKPGRLGLALDLATCLVGVLMMALSTYQAVITWH